MKMSPLLSFYSFAIFISLAQLSLFAMDKSIESILDAIQSHNTFKVKELLKENPKLDTKIERYRNTTLSYPCSILQIAELEMVWVTYGGKNQEENSIRETNEIVRLLENYFSQNNIDV